MILFLKKVFLFDFFDFVFQKNKSTSESKNEVQTS